MATYIETSTFPIRTIILLLALNIIHPHGHITHLKLIVIMLCMVVGSRCIVLLCWMENLTHIACWRLLLLLLLCTMSIYHRTIVHLLIVLSNIAIVHGLKNNSLLCYDSVKYKIRCLTLHIEKGRL